MDIKEKIEELVEKVKSDKDFAAKFKADPITAVEGVLGIDLPNDKIEQIVDGIKVKLASGELKEKLGGIGKLFS